MEEDDVIVYATDTSGVAHGFIEMNQDAYDNLTENGQGPKLMPVDTSNINQNPNSGQSFSIPANKIEAESIEANTVKPEVIFDPVLKPKHYNVHGSGIECIDIVGFMPYPAGNAVKYVWRFEDKDKPLEDLEKAMWYLNWCIEHNDALDMSKTKYTGDIYNLVNSYYDWELTHGNKHRAQCIWYLCMGDWEYAERYLNKLAAGYNDKVEQKSGVTLQGIIKTPDGQVHDYTKGGYIQEPESMDMSKVINRLNDIEQRLEQSRGGNEPGTNNRFNALEELVVDASKRLSKLEAKLKQEECGLENQGIEIDNQLFDDESLKRILDYLDKVRKRFDRING